MRRQVKPAENEVVGRSTIPEMLGRGDDEPAAAIHPFGAVTSAPDFPGALAGT